jgi:hypothetical protein
LRRQRRGAPAMEGEVEDELLLLSRVKRELAWMKSEIWLVCWSVSKYREVSWLNGNMKNEIWLDFWRCSNFCAAKFISSNYDICTTKTDIRDDHITK